MCHSAEYILELYICILIQTIQLLIFTEKFSPLPGASFWPPSMVYISVINTQKLQITFLHDIRIQIRTIQLLIFTEKFSPLPGFEPGTSLVPSQYATNWAILAWIQIIMLACSVLK